jgi:hypothetical protein
MEIDPLKLPVVVGAKVAVIVQNASLASEAGATGQLLLSEKGAAGDVMLVNTRGAVPVFVRRTDRAALVVPIA